MGVDEQREVVGPVAEEGEPLRVPDNHVEFVAMDDEIAPSVGRRVDRLPFDLDAAEGQTEELTGELVVVAGNEHHPGAAADLAQQLLDDVVMRLRPVPAGAQAPAVDDVAYQIDRVSLDVAQHIQDKMGLAAARSQVQVRQEKRPVTVDLVRLRQRAASSRGGEQTRTLCTDSRVASMT